MIKVFKIRTILKTLILLTAIVVSILVIKNKVKNKKVVATSSNNKQKYKILVDVEESKLYLFENDELKKEYKCSGGKWSTPSPIGTWTVTSKAKWGEGFGGSWMGLNVPWGKFGIHGTLDPYSLGWSSSHGCIRMDNDVIVQLSKEVKPGSYVLIQK